MAWDSTKPADNERIGAIATEIRANWTAIAAVVGVTKLANGTPIVDAIPSGNTFTMWIYADTAPTGWTAVAAIGDELLAVKGGTTYTTGGDVAGAWDLPEHTLTVDEIPAHSHTLQVYTDISGGGARILSRELAGSGATTSETGGGDPHSHGDTYRPTARVGILASKD